MMYVPRSHLLRRWSARVMLAASVLGCTLDVAIARDRFLVTPEGRRIRLIKSDSEFAVTFREGKDIQVSARRLSASGQGAITDITGAARSRIKMLRVPQASVARRSLIRQDPAIAEVRPVYRFEGVDVPLVSTGSIVVKLPAGLSAAERNQLWDQYRVRVVQRIDGLRNVYCVKPMIGDEDEVLRAEVLAEDKRILWAEPNFRTPPQRKQVNPSDAFFDLQWHLNSTGQLGVTIDADIDAPEAWVFSEGLDVTIGMFDDACDVDHEDLRGNYIGTGHDPSLQSNDSGFDDPRPKAVGDRHGTAVMGLAVSRPNSIGGRGVSYLSRFTVSRGLGELLTNAEVASVYTFARQQEVDVHNNSWGFSFGVITPAVIRDAIETAFLEGRDLDGENGPQPPRGMVILFASGNGINNFGPGVRVEAGKELATLPTVIGVGASNARDLIASYSDFGPEIDVLAPGGGDFAGITTTDNNDAAGFVDDGFNIGGFDEFDFQDIDPNGLYTGGFAGTSAACPIAAGVAALTLSVNPLLTATDVRLILEHTVDRIDPDDAGYASATGRSLRYGYGRINALAAVQAARDSNSNGGRTWPERAAEVRFLGTELRWLQNGNPLEFVDEEDLQDGAQAAPLQTTDEFLVIESDSPFQFDPRAFPVDGDCYDAGQLGCGSAILQPLPSGARVLRVGCTLACGASATTECKAGAEQCIDFIQPASRKFYAIYARNTIGRYSFGVQVDSDGNVLDTGVLPPGASGVIGGGGGGGTTGDQPAVGPSVTIVFTPRSGGTSPLSVTFTGNAPSDLPIDETRTAWDFDLDDDTTVDSTTRHAEHTYVVAAGESKTFLARLTMFDIAGNPGSDQVAIQVDGPGEDAAGGVTGNNIQINLTEPGGATEVDSGVSPFDVELEVQATGLAGNLQSVVWDLGDGATEEGTLVFHTYKNDTPTPLRLQLLATVTTLTESSTTIRTTASKTITVFPGVTTVTVQEPVCDGCLATGAGGTAVPCGAIGMLPLFVSVTFLTWMRRRGAMASRPRRRAS